MTCTKCQGGCSCGERYLTPQWRSRKYMISIVFHEPLRATRSLLPDDFDDCSSQQREVFIFSA